MSPVQDKWSRYQMHITIVGLLFTIIASIVGSILAVHDSYSQQRNENLNFHQSIGMRMDRVEDVINYLGERDDVKQDLLVEIRMNQILLTKRLGIEYIKMVDDSRIAKSKNPITTTYRKEPVK